MRVAAGEKFAAKHGAAADQIAPDLKWVTMDDQHRWSSDPASCELAIYASQTYNDTFIEALVDMHNLRWGHSEDAGTDGRFVDSLSARGVTLTHSPGTNAPEVAEMALGFLLWSAKRLDDLRNQQAARHWNRIALHALSDQHALVVGLGAIGGRIVELCRAFGMTVSGIRASSEPVPRLHRQGTLADLSAMAAAADYVILAVPITESTAGIVDPPLLATMKESSVLINVGRGGLVDSTALHSALTKGTIRGACLDVVHSEPLPAADPLWEAPNLLITPHCASETPLYMMRVGEVWLDNLRRYRSGETMRNLVSR